MENESWELTDFNIDGHIVLSSKFGLVKLMRSDDGLLILIENRSQRVLMEKVSVPTSFFNPVSTLGFVLDIGIQKKKWLTYGKGYFGMQTIHTQSKKKISQTDFNQELFEKIGTLIDSHFQSKDKAKEMEAMRLQYLLNDYNNARLLYPNFYAESYLSLMRIIDALGSTEKDHSSAIDYAVFVATISSKFNQELFEKMSELTQVYAPRLTKASILFDTVFKKTKPHWPSAKVMAIFNDADKFVFACFYSAYQYRNKFVHKGYPFPGTVKEAWGLEDDSGTAYINPVLGISFPRFNNPTEDAKIEDMIDIHDAVGSEGTIFKETYFLLLPTWHFLRRLAKEALLKKIQSLTITD